MDNTHENNTTNNSTHTTITRRQRFLRFGWYPIGHVTLLAGDPGVGKSYLTHELAAMCTDLDRNVLIISLEDGINDTIVPRMAMMRANLDHAHITNTPLRLDEELDTLEEYIKTHNITLVIIDPVTAFMGAYNSDNNNDVRTMLTRLSMLAEACDAAIVCVTHLSKADDWEARQGVRALGARAFTEAVPVVVVVTDEHRGRRRMSMLKNTLCPLPPDETFQITGDRGVVFDPLDLDEEASGEGTRSRPRPRLKHKNTQKADAAIALLVHILRSGPVPTQEILERGKAHGLSKNTLIRAKEVLKVRSIKRGKAWYWTRSSPEQGRK